MELFVQMNKQYRYCLCKRCGSLVLIDLPDVDKLYSTEESTGNISEYIDSTIRQERIEMISAPKVDFVLNVCKENEIVVNSWLDIGCGGGEVLSFLKEKTKIDGTGIESDPKEVAFAKSLGLNIVESFIDPALEINELNEIIYRSDIVSFFNVLEHIENPVEFINYLYKRMHNVALLAFEVPRHPSLASFGNLTHDSIIYRHITPPVHLQIFSEKAIGMILDGKFSMISSWEFGQGFTDLLNYAMISSGIQENELYDQIMQASNSIQLAVDEAGLADQILVIAKKADIE